MVQADRTSGEVSVDRNTASSNGRLRARCFERVHCYNFPIALSQSSELTGVIFFWVPINAAESRAMTLIVHVPHGTMRLTSCLVHFSVPSKWYVPCKLSQFRTLKQG